MVHYRRALPCERLVHPAGSRYLAAVTFIALPGVYAPQDDTALLAGALREESAVPNAEVLDIGTGTGALALVAAQRGYRVTAVDVSRRAVLTAKVNAWLARARVHVLRGNLLAPSPGAAST